MSLRPLLVLAVLLPACGTIPESAGGAQNLPSANAGPFRALVATEIGNTRVAPVGLSDIRGYGRDVAILDLDGDPKTAEVAAYVAAAVVPGATADMPPSAIQRYTALDGRSFERQADTVLSADQDWEGGLVAQPAILRRADELWLFYATKGGIGLARGKDGKVFTKEQGPVLPTEPGGWEKGIAPQSPGVVRLPDGSFRMFYEVASTPDRSVIAEARSSDGLSWKRVGAGPVLEPSGRPGDVVSDAGDAPYDGASVGSPFPILAKSGDDREIVRVYFGAVDALGNRTIGLAARYGNDGPLDRGLAPVFGGGKIQGAREPCVVAYDGFQLLYVTQSAGGFSTAPVIGIGVAPATAVLPPPNPK